MRLRGGPRAEGRKLTPSPEEVEQSLHALAVDELSTDAATLGRVREAVMAAASSRVPGESRLGPGLAPAAPLPARAGARWRRPFGRLRLAVVGLAATALVVASAGFAAAESGPGQPFYRIRLSIEAVGLPPAGSPDRADADVRRAESRLQEMTRAASQGDWNAVADAAGAYTEVVSSLVLPSDQARLARIHKRLEDQLSRLTGLRATADRSVAAALDRAIDRLNEVVGRAAPKPGSRTGGGPGGGRSGQPEPGQSGVPMMPGTDVGSRLTTPRPDAYRLR